MYTVVHVPVLEMNSETSKVWFTLGFYSQTQKLEPPCMPQQAALKASIAH